MFGFWVCDARQNEDGFLSWDEFSGPKGTRRPQPGDRQREMDEFGTFNAEVGAGEVPTTYVQPVLDINLFASMDANADHGITFEEMDDYFSRATDTVSVGAIFFGSRSYCLPVIMVDLVPQFSLLSSGRRKNNFNARTLTEMDVYRGQNSLARRAQAPTTVQRSLHLRR